MSKESLDRALQTLTKWRKFFASWQVGTRPPTDGEYRAIVHHRELSILLRAEVSALRGLMVTKGVFTEDEWARALEAEAKQLNQDYARAYPGWAATDRGMNMKMPAALETMKRLGFPP